MSDSKAIDSMMNEKRKFAPPSALSQKAWIKSFEDYKKLYDQSIKDPEKFWSEAAKEFVWFEPWKNVCSYDFKDKIEIKWFEGGKTNITVNALDRHVKAGNGDRIAFYWEGNEPGESSTYTYKQLHDEVCKFANVLKTQDVKKGDRVSIYMPMIIELTVAMLACARIGAIHSIVFGGFSAESLRDRIVDSNCKTIITSDISFQQRCYFL